MRRILRGQALEVQEKRARLVSLPRRLRRRAIFHPESSVLQSYSKRQARHLPSLLVRRLSSFLLAEFLMLQECGVARRRVPLLGVQKDAVRMNVGRQCDGGY